MVCPPIQQPGHEPRELMGSGPIPAMTAAISVCFRMLTYHLLVSGLNTHDPAYSPVIKHSNGQYTVFPTYTYIYIYHNCHLYSQGICHCFPLPSIAMFDYRRCIVDLQYPSPPSMSNIGNHGLVYGKTYRITMVLYGFPMFSP